MTSRVVALTGLLAVLLLTACGQQAAPGGASPPPTVVARPDLVPDVALGPFEVTGFVLADASHGPHLCLARADSLPPQCSGTEVRGFDFGALPTGSYESAGGTQWGTFVLTGEVEGDAITLTGPVRPVGSDDGPRAPEPSFASPCPEPEGGWRPVDPARATEAAQQAASARAESVEGYGLVWIDQPNWTEEEVAAGLANDPLQYVLNVSTAGDLAEMEAAVREEWGGALCVSRAERSEAELIAARDELDARRDELGLVDLQLDSVGGQVTATALLAREADQRRLDEEFGAGVVRLSSLLRPVSR